MVAPIVTFKVVKIDEDICLETVTPLADKFLGLMLTYTGMFKDPDSLKEHLLTDYLNADDQCLDYQLVSGTQMYFCEIRVPLQVSEVGDIVCLTGRPTCQDEINVSLVT